MKEWNLKRNDTGQILSLHAQYTWSDEYAWTALAQSAPVYMLSGAVDVQQGTKLAGRPITLDSSFARITRGDIKTLQAWAAIPENTLTLTHPDGRNFNVLFKQPPLTDIKVVQPVRPSDEADSDAMTAHLNFLTV